MAGAGVVLAGVESDRLRLGLALDGFIELINFDQGEPVPWESYRANVGFEVLAESPTLARALLPPGGRLYLAVGWFHESDHAANEQGYIAQYLAPPSYLPGEGAIYPSLDNGNFSSYEYVKLRAVYRQPLLRGRLTAQSALGARLFPGAIDPGSIRSLRAAVSPKRASRCGSARECAPSPRRTTSSSRTISSRRITGSASGSTGRRSATRSCTSAWIW